ncbi:hypothetical protein Cgig2_023077 [Carnegiea gigantea]|uniref:GRF-like zinc ribbon domain-containing protein n=1 Tax=Carnegiea gigantea TaxID=171969 RepID=A0A9Q1JY77_9CARY|nr:hypothetical protein Cgig2_023077 [Carnegiea gigantea]
MDYRNYPFFCGKKGRQPWKVMEAKSVLFDSDCSSTLSVQAAMEGLSQSFGSPASNSRICCPKCKVATELEYSISRSEKNFLRPYYACLKCGGFVCWAEQEGRGDSMGTHERGSINRGRQRAEEEAGSAVNEMFICTSFEVLTMCSFRCTFSTKGSNAWAFGMSKCTGNPSATRTVPGFLLKILVATSVSVTKTVPAAHRWSRRRVAKAPPSAMAGTVAKKEKSSKKCKKGKTSSSNETLNPLKLARQKCERKNGGCVVEDTETWTITEVEEETSLESEESTSKWRNLDIVLAIENKELNALKHHY